MSFDKLERNIVSVIKESQAKLGYEKMPLGINYIKPVPPAQRLHR